MRVLHLITGLGTGGAETMLCKLLSGIDRAQDEHMVLSLTNGGAMRGRLQELGVPVHSLALPRGSVSLLAAITLVRQVSDLKPDLIQGWMYHGNIAASFAAFWLRPRPQIVWNVRHALNSEQGRKPLTSLLIKLGAWWSSSTDTILFNSRQSAAQHEKLGYDAARTAVIPNGFEPSRFAPDGDAYRDVRRELGIPQNAGVIGMVGRHHPLKDQPNFIKAAQRMAAAAPGWHFVLVGAGVERTTPVLAEFANTEELSGRIHLLGERADIPRLVAAMDIAVNSSLSEGFANAIGEAMSCEVPCVVTDVGDSAWIIGNTGLVVPAGDSEALAAALLRMTDMGASERKALGVRARHRIVEEFSLDRIVKDYQAVYAKVSGVRKDYPQCAE